MLKICKNVLTHFRMIEHGLLMTDTWVRLRSLIGENNIEVKITDWWF